MIEKQLQNFDQKSENNDHKIEIPADLFMCCKCIAIFKERPVIDIVTSILERELIPLLNLIQSF